MIAYRGRHELKREVNLPNEHKVTVNVGMPKGEWRNKMTDDETHEIVLDRTNDDGLLNMRTYPKFMFMDMYGNGCKAWEQLDTKDVDSVIFRVKYVRADLVAIAINKARTDGYEAALSYGSTKDHQ